MIHLMRLELLDHFSLVRCGWQRSTLQLNSRAFEPLLAVLLNLLELTIQLLPLLR